MKASVSTHQLNQLFVYISKEYSIYGTTTRNGKPSFELLSNFDQVLTPTPKAIIPFKKILYPDALDLEKKIEKKKIAFWGITNCDVQALKIFLTLPEINSLTPTSEILIVSTECQSDNQCFCTAVDSGEIRNFDIHIQTEKNKSLSIFAGTSLGKTCIDQLKTDIESRSERPRTIILPKIEKINLKNVCLGIMNKTENIEYWQNIADNCFGCGACTAVCPLCFCTGKDFENLPDGSCKKCLNWDSCFAKSFSEISNHHDMRPTNTDRLYNWYHHKFVRAPYEGTRPLCTGCGRCITACPAHLSQYGIIAEAAKSYQAKLKKEK
jgi:sulfhydrogenase subunit beta (sulfur reductase)